MFTETCGYMAHTEARIFKNFRYNPAMFKASFHYELRMYVIVCNNFLVHITNRKIHYLLKFREHWELIIGVKSRGENVFLSK